MLQVQPVAPVVRSATVADLESIRRIYNEGIEDRIATLDEEPKTVEDMAAWWQDRQGRYAVLIAEDRAGSAVGWASLNPYSHRCAYRGVADLSIYVSRDVRGNGIGSVLLGALERRAKEAEFHKVVLFALTSNAHGLALYRKFGFREVGVFKEQGRLGGGFVDVIAMEKILKPFVLFVCKHNTGRSQMAEAFLRRFAGDAVEVASAGTIAASHPDPGVISIMAEVDMDISHAQPKLIDRAMLARADRIITMGCDVESVPRIDDDWGLPDPKGQSPERVREIRDLVCTKAGKLAKDLSAV